MPASLLLPRVRTLINRVPGAGPLYRWLKGQHPAKRRPLKRGPRPIPDFAALAASYHNTALAAERDTFILYRIIGNDLVPRHQPGQSRENLRFILENEPTLEACEKRYILNRILDRDEESEILQMLERAGAPYLRLPFDANHFLSADWDIKGVPADYAPYGRRFAKLPPEEQQRLLLRLYRHKNNAVMNNNGARNLALQEGRQLAKWVLPWDGNCFLSADAWAQLRAAVTQQPHLPYFVVPMARLDDNRRLLDPKFYPVANEEPQIVFRKDATLTFDERHSYGRRPKVDLLWRLGVPGPWDHWEFEPWDFPPPAFAPQAGQFETASWVARLASGNAHLENNSEARLSARTTAIMWFLDHLEERLRSPEPSKRQPKTVLKAAPLPIEQALRNTADALKVSGDRGDFDSKDPRMSFAVDYANRPLQRLFEDTRILTLATLAFRDVDYGRAAVAQLRHRFAGAYNHAAINHRSVPGTAKVKSRDKSASSQIGEMDFCYPFLDALACLTDMDILPGDDHQKLVEWLHIHLLLLRDQPPESSGAPGTVGIYKDLQCAAITSFLDDRALFRSTLRNSRFRRLTSLPPGATQAEHLHGKTTVADCCLNLLGWVQLEQLASAQDDRLASFANHNDRSLAADIKRCAQQMTHSGISSIGADYDQGALIATAYLSGLTKAEVDTLGIGTATSRDDAVLAPHWGIPPFWQYGIPIVQRSQ